MNLHAIRINRQQQRLGDMGFLCVCVRVSDERFFLFILFFINAARVKGFFECSFTVRFFCCRGVPFSYASVLCISSSLSS